MMPETVYLVSCVAKKQPRPAAARDLYVSAWFQKARAYVEQQDAPWFILSAEHGLLHPDEVVAPYERTLNTLGVKDRRAWAERVKAQMDARLPRLSRVILLAGQRYREFLIDDLERRARSVEVPMEGLTIGRQLAWLDASADNGA